MRSARDLQRVEGNERSVALFLISRCVLLTLGKLLPCALERFVMPHLQSLQRRILSLELLPKLRIQEATPLVFCIKC